MRFNGAKLRELRHKKGMTMRELSRLTGTHQGALSQIETNQKNPRPKTVESIAKAMGVEEWYFYKDGSVLSDILPHIPEDLRDFIVDEEALPFIAICKKAHEHRISPVALSNIVDALIANATSP